MVWKENGVHLYSIQMGQLYGIQIPTVPIFQANYAFIWD